MEANKLLVVEDDPNLGALLTEYLDAKGYEVELAKDGQQGYEVFAKNTFDLCILDVMMPVKDGFTLASELKKLDKHIPILFLTAKSMKEDTLEGFKRGGDDYVTKPFSMEELLMRIRAILRRTGPAAESKLPQKIELGTFEFDHHLQVLKSKDGEEKRLTSKENHLLKLLAKNKNEVLERSVALNAIWGDDSYFNSRSMDVYIAKLRKFLKPDPNLEIINVHGRGFKLIEKV